MQTLDDFLPETADATGGSELEVLRLSETPALVTIFTNNVGAVIHSLRGVPEPEMRIALQYRSRIPLSPL